MLFEPFEFSGMKLKNRVVSVPVVSNLATEDGYVTDNLIERYRRIAEGETIVKCVYCNHCSEVNDLFQLTDCVQWPKGSINAPKPFLPKQKRKGNAEEAV